MYAIVRSGGKQHRVAVGDVISVDRLGAGTGETVVLPALLHVDGETVTTDAQALAGVRVDAEVMSNTKGPKIDILRYKNKSGYRRRQGHRAKLTTLRVTAINTVDQTAVEQTAVDQTAVEQTAGE